MNLRESWNRVAPDYLSRSLPPDVFRYSLYAPSEAHLRLLGDVRGKRVLDLGCGGGHNCVALAQHGANCTGVDFSDVQIDYARCLAKQGSVEVTFVCAPMEEFLPGETDAGFDVVVSTGALQYVNDLGLVLKHVRRVLGPGGLFALAVDHPLRTSTCVEGGRVVFSASYHSVGRDNWEWEHGPDRTRTPFHSYRHTVADYVNILIRAGFRIERMREPEPIADYVQWTAEEMEHLATVPATLILTARPNG